MNDTETRRRGDTGHWLDYANCDHRSGAWTLEQVYRQEIATRRATARRQSRRRVIGLVALLAWTLAGLLAAVWRTQL